MPNLINRRRSMALLGGLAAATALARQAAAQDVAAPTWRAEHGGATVYLIAGWHSLRAGDDWLRSGVAEAIGKADTVFVEAIQQRGLMREVERTRLMVMPPSDRLSKRLPPEAAAKFLQRIADLKIPKAIDRYRPIFGTEFLRGAYVGRTHGFSPAFGLEAAFTHFARKDRLQGLEDPLEGTRAFATMEEDRALAWLAKVVMSLESRGQEEVECVERWRRGDLAFVEAWARRGLGDGDPQLWEAVVDKRQQAWLPKILAAAERAPLTVVGTGSAHMVGDGGLPALLQRSGFRVERV